LDGIKEQIERNHSNYDGEMFDVHEDGEQEKREKGKTEKETASKSDEQENEEDEEGEEEEGEDAEEDEEDKEDEEDVEERDKKNGNSSKNRSNDNNSGNNCINDSPVFKTPLQEKDYQHLGDFDYQELKHALSDIPLVAYTEEDLRGFAFGLSILMYFFTFAFVTLPKIL